MRVRIGVSDSPREIELDIDDMDPFVEEAEAALSGKTDVLWVTDTEGHKVGIPSGKIGFIDIAPEGRRSAGFSAP